MSVPRHLITHNSNLITLILWFCFIHFIRNGLSGVRRSNLSEPLFQKLKKTLPYSSPLNPHAMPSTLFCFGEVLWDLLPTGKIAGGAPMNVAFQANQLGLSAKMVSRVGADDWGVELLDFLNDKGVSTQFVQTDPRHPTGLVNVTLDSKGSPAYEIVQPSAWDFIAPDPALHDAVRRDGAQPGQHGQEHHHRQHARHEAAGGIARQR